MDEAEHCISASKTFSEDEYGQEGNEEGDAEGSGDLPSLPMPVYARVEVQEQRALPDDPLPLLSFSSDTLVPFELNSSGSWDMASTVNREAGGTAGEKRTGEDVLLSTVASPIASSFGRSASPNESTVMEMTPAVVEFLTLCATSQARELHLFSQQQPLPSLADLERYAGAHLKVSHVVGGGVH